MTLQAAKTMVHQWEQVCSSCGLDAAEHYYLAKGTEHYAGNLAMLQEAMHMVHGENFGPRQREAAEATRELARC